VEKLWRPGSVEQAGSTACRSKASSLSSAAHSYSSSSTAETSTSAKAAPNWASSQALNSSDQLASTGLLISTSKSSHRSRARLLALSRPAATNSREMSPISRVLVKDSNYCHFFLLLLGGGQPVFRRLKDFTGITGASRSQ